MLNSGRVNEFPHKLPERGVLDTIVEGIKTEVAPQ
jgi:hypothetical protein